MGRQKAEREREGGARLRSGIDGLVRLRLIRDPASVGHDTTAHLPTMTTINGCIESKGPARFS
jgi:hypothetical protein